MPSEVGGKLEAGTTPVRRSHLTCVLSHLREKRGEEGSGRREQRVLREADPPGLAHSETAALVLAIVHPYLVYGSCVEVTECQTLGHRLSTLPTS